MPYAQSQGARIHYHVEGEGPPLVLQHGFSDSVVDWYETGYVDALKNEYQLILVDARGHGRSDKPHDSEAYEMKLTVLDITSVLDALGIGKAHYFGYSMGGRIGFGIARFAADRVHSLILGGMHPYKRDPEERNQQVELLRKGMEAVLAAREEQSGPLPPQRRARLLANDAEALAASTIATRDQPGYEDVLPTMAMPCLLYVGEHDVGFYQGTKECAGLIPNGSFVSLPGLDHTQAFRQSNLVLPHVKRFLASVSQT